MKSTATTLAKTRREVPQLLGLIRVSGNSQDFSRQEEDLETIEEEEQVQVFERLEIKGLSGTATLNDAEIQRILRKLREPGVAGLAISAIDRLGRATRGEAMRIIDPFIDARKPIYSAREGRLDPWTDEGFVACINGLVRGGSELRETRRRSMGAKKKLEKSGANCAGTPPYGYKRVSRKRNGEWVIVQEEAAVIREMFRLGAMGWTGYKIAKWLNKLDEFADREGDRILSRGHRLNPDRFWSDAVARQTMTNTAYIGTRRSKNTATIPVPAILATAEQRAWWDKVAANRVTNPEQRSGRPSSNYLAQHYLYCARCERRMTGRRAKRTRHIYECLHQDPFTHKSLCSTGEMRADTFDQAFYNRLIDRLSQEETLWEAIREHQKRLNIFEPEGKSKAERIAKLQRDLKLINTNINDSDLLAFREENKRKFQTVQAQIAVLERELAHSDKVFRMPSLIQVRDAAREFAAAREWTEFKDRRGLVERTVSRILYADRKFTVEGRVYFGSSLSKQTGQNPYSDIDANIGFVPFSFSGKVAA